MAADGSSAEALARVLLGPALNVRRGENVIVETWTHTLPYATACVTEARRRGARPMLLYEDEPAYWRSWDLVPKRELGKVGTHEWAALSKAQAYVFFPGPADRPRLRAQGRDAFQSVAYNLEWYRRAKSAHLRGVRSILGYASNEAAAELRVDPTVWREQLVRASVQADPAAIKRDAAKVAARLQKGREFHLTAANGTDLKLSLRGRAPVVDDGIVDAGDLRRGYNMTAVPPGWVAVAIDEKSAAGLVVANRPSFPRMGRVEGGQWEFDHGQMVSCSFTDGGAAFERATQTVTPGWNRGGFISLGLNPALDPGVARVEDAEAGAVAVAIGGNAEYGGTNSNPFLAWLVVGEATVALDGKPLIDRGKLL